MKPTQQDSTFDLTPAEEMEAEERELIIEDSVDDLVTYSNHPLSDCEIENKRLHLEDIKPEPEGD